MTEVKDLFQSAEWRKEKHVPVIDAPDMVKKGDWVNVTLTVGKEISHPNTTEHHIRWVSVFFLPDGEKFPRQLARIEFDAHGESAAGPDTSAIYAHPKATVTFLTQKPGLLMASSYCNIHGLWQSSKKLDTV
jgi:superoxide reductase